MTPQNHRKKTRLQNELFRDLAQCLEERDRFARNFPIVQQITNWLLALSAGLLIWFISSINAFSQNSILYNKELHLFGVIIAAFTCVCFVISKLFCFVRLLGISIALDDIENFVDKANLRGYNPEEVEKKWLETSRRAVFIWRFSHNLAPSILYISALGSLFLSAGVVVAAIYVAKYVMK